MKNSLVLPILVVLTSLLGAPENARTQSIESSSIELLSYSDLMQMPTEKRTQYIQGVREILIDLSKRPDGKFSDHDPGAKSRLKAWLEVLDREMKIANAAEADDGDEVAPAKRQHLAEPIKIIVPSDAPPLLEPQSVRGRFGAIISVSQNDTITTFVSKENLDVMHFKCISTHRAVSLPGSQNLPACSANVEAQIQKRFDDGKAALVTREIPAADVPSQPVAESKTAVSRRIPFSEITPYLDRKENPAKLCDEEAKKAGGGPMDLVAIESSQDRFCMTKEAEARYKLGELRLDHDGRIMKPGDRDRRAADPVVGGRGEERKYSCAPKPDVCEIPKSAAAKIFKGGQTCIFAGMFSVFNSGNTRCQAQTEFVLGEKKYTCATGQTMCNPLLFGTVSTTTPICIGHSLNATEQCSKLSSSRDAEKFLNRAENGLQEKWNDFRKAFAETCKPKSESAKFHCDECNVMKTRIFDLQARLLPNPCGGGRADDGEHAVDLRIKLGAPKNSGTKR